MNRLGQMYRKMSKLDANKKKPYYTCEIDWTGKFGKVIRRKRRENKV